MGRNIMIKITSKKLVSSLIATIAISTVSLNAADTFGSVNGDKITKEDLAVVLRNPNIDFNSLPKKSKDQVLNQVVEKKLLTQKAIKSGISNDTSYKQALEKLKKDLALEIWMQKEFKKVTVSEKDKKDYYNKNKDKFKVPSTLEARHILTKTENEKKKKNKKVKKKNGKKKKKKKKS